MKRILLLFAVVLTALQMWAADVSISQAKAAANAFLTKQVANGHIKAAAASNLKLVKAEASVARPEAVDYYIFNSESSYVVIAGDDLAPQILMYGEHGALDINNIPDGMQWLLNKYKYQIDGLKAGTMVPISIPKTATAVPPLVNANWDQSAPYNNQCPTSGGSRAVTGCPATSLAMCYYKWKWPETFPACAAISGTSGYSAAALPERAADWDNIIDEYTGPTNYSSTTAQKNAVAWLMRYAGQCIPDYQYSSSASGANDPEIYQGVLNMGYTDAQYLLLTELKSSGWSYTNGPQQYTDAQWNNFMLNELYNGRPIEYLAYDVSGYSVSGHAFNVFGCDASGKYYVNWGWSGDSNGYCTLHNFTTSTGSTGQSGSYVFKYGEAMIIGIEPPEGALGSPVLSVNPTSLSFTGCTTSQTYTKTFTVSASNLTDNVTISSDNNNFTVSPSTLTAAQAQAGATITVTFAPTTAGSQSGTITVASSGANNKTVSVTGSATAPPISLSVDPTSLTFSGCNAGGTYTQTFTVTGTNVTGNVNISSNNSVFSVSPASLTAAQALAGATITVTYSPTATGTQSGTISVSTSGATTKTVSVTGTASAAAPSMTVTPNTLDMSTEVGTPVTATFNLKGSNLTSTVYLAVSGAGFSIDKSNLTANAANNGRTITVTYNPTAGGTHTGTVTLTSTGAETVTVALNGTAISVDPVINVNPASLSFNTVVGTPVTQTFTVTGVNLSGTVYLSCNGTGFSIDKTNITKSAATAGSTVTVTYNPTVFGNHTGAVTLTSSGAQPVTVSLNGSASMLKFAPVMLPADENYINLTKFRADWTDQTAAENIASYTLEVSAKAVEPEPEPEPVLIGSIVGTDFTGGANSYYDITLPAPWGGTATRGGLNSIIYFRNNYDNDGVYGNITYTIPAGYENVTFTMKITTGSSGDGAGNLTVATPQTAAVNHTFASGETYSWLVTASSGDKITITTPDDRFSPDIARIEVYSGNATEAKLRANESGDATYRLITGITDRFYTVENLTAEGTFLYKVKALYLDGTESEWSNTEEVTLFANTLIGDVNKDGTVSIKDVTDLIDYLLGGSGEGLDLVAADFNQDNSVSIKDATDLIDYLLGGGGNTLNVPRQNFNPYK